MALTFANILLDLVDPDEAITKISNDRAIKLADSYSSRLKTIKDMVIRLRLDGIYANYSKTDIILSTMIPVEGVLQKQIIKNYISVDSAIEYMYSKLGDVSYVAGSTTVKGRAYAIVGKSQQDIDFRVKVGYGYSDVPSMKTGYISEALINATEDYRKINNLIPSRLSH